MGSDIGILFAILGVIAGITLFVLALIFVAVPVFKGIGWSITGIFRLIGWLIMHIVEFVGGVLGDAVRFIGSLLVMLVLLPLVPLNIIIGRWSAAGHFAEGIKRECSVGAACVYRAVLRRPLKLLLLDGVLEGLEQRLPEAMAHAPGADQPSRRTGQFDGYTIVGSLRSGGSGAKLYVAQPSDEKRHKIGQMPERVVIKAFALTEGSSLPQIVRESRALECAKQLGHVLDHGMDDHRFFYVMPYHPGEHLGVLTRQFHAECGGRGLDRRRLRDVISHAHDLLATLSAYHKGGLWHKDVKPENVIVHDGRAHLVDLGLVTPLRSAMTLTTHGTEYFRDPEMVRQALRGVKVHQVDGAKFDIYAAGAVLYFMIENTFPAHGGLSRITQPSPEALRWIVRRAMTDYNQRYETADAMLGDLAFVMRASDPHAVKPAELPSMRGFGATDAAAEASADEPGQAASHAHTHTHNLPHGERTAKDHVAAAMSAAGAAVASAMSAVSAALGGGAAGAGDAAARNAAGTGSKEFVMSAGIDERGPFAKVNGVDVGAADSSARRPKIVVTNWWTGAYRVENEDGSRTPAANGDGIPFAQPVDAAEARMFRGHASAFRAQADDFRRKVKEGTMSARRAAREQIRAARSRAREMQARASAHRKHVVIARHPSMSPWLFTVGFLVLALLGGAVMMTVFRARVGHSANVSSNLPGVPLLLVLNGADSDNPRVQHRIKQIVAERTREGYDVITSSVNDASLCALVDEWREKPNGPADAAIEDLLARHNAYGVLQVSISGDARRDKNVKELLVRSTRPGARDRRRVDVRAIVPEGAAPEQPYLLLNDHPAKTDPEVEAVINQTIEAYRAKGWDLKVADDIEVEVRKLLPPGKIESAATLPFMLRETLDGAQLGGVVRIEAAPGEGKPRDRVVVTIVHGADLPKMPEPQAAPEEPKPEDVETPADPVAMALPN